MAADDERTVYVTVPSRLVAHINFGYQFDQPLAIWRWYWMRRSERHHIFHALFSPLVGFIAAFLIWAPLLDSTFFASVAWILFGGGGLLLGVVHFQNARQCGKIIARIKCEPLLIWDIVEKHVDEICAQTGDDDPHEEVCVQLEPDDLIEPLFPF